MDKGQGVDSFGFAFGRRPSTSSLGDGRCHLVAGRFVKVARNGFAFAVAAVVIGIDEPTPTIKHDEVQTKQVARTRLLVRSRVAAHVADNVGQGHDVILGQRQRLDFAQLALQLDVRDDGSQLLLSKLVDRMATRKKIERPVKVPRTRRWDCACGGVPVHCSRVVAGCALGQTCRAFSSLVRLRLHSSWNCCFGRYCARRRDVILRSSAGRFRFPNCPMDRWLSPSSPLQKKKKGNRRPLSAQHQLELPVSTTRKCGCHGFATFHSMP